MLTLKRAVLVVTLIASALGLSAFLPAHPSSPGLGTAHADPGFCGVRNSTAPAPGTGIMYVVRNKCNFTIQVHVWLPSANRYATAGCKYIGPGGFGYFADARVDQNWSVRHC